MQPTTKQPKHLFFSGVKGIKAQLENKAKINITDEKFTFVPAKDDFIRALIADRKHIKEWILSQPTEQQEDLFKIIKRLRAEAITHILYIGTANESQIRALQITEYDILFERAYLSELISYATAQLSEDPIFKTGLIQLAKGGKLIDYTELNRLSDSLEYFYSRKIELSTIKTKKPEEREKYNTRGELIEYKLQETPEEARIKEMQTGILIQANTELTLKDCIYKIRELRKLLRIEIYKTSAEKSIPKNLCTFLLFNPQPFDTTKTPDEILLETVSTLRKSNLLVLIRLLCNINNAIYKTEIETAQKLIIKMNRPLKKISATEKRDLIQLGKSEGMKQTEVAKSIPCSLETVKRGWN